MSDDNRMDVDILIIGAGPAGLAASIRLQQLAKDANQSLKICVIEKGSEVGAHTLSGAVFEPRALNELLPEWPTLNAPLSTSVTHDEFVYLTKTGKFALPLPTQLHNQGNYIISLGQFCRWLAKQAEQMGVEIYPGFAASEVLFSENGTVIGIKTGEFGRDKQGLPKDEYQPGMAIYAKYTLFAEGCRGSLSERLMERFQLREQVDSQTYGLGIKEIWEIDPSLHQAGHVMHSVGWPLDQTTYGGGFVYHYEQNYLSIGMVVGLDYQNPHLSPFEEFQRFKTHPKIMPLLKGGRRVSYGARALNEGGWQSIPKLTFPGGALIGCSAGFVNIAKIKGNHTAMKSGMIAAEAVFEALNNHEITPINYETKLRHSWVMEELYQVRNIRPGFSYGRWFGLFNAALELFIFKGKMPWTLHHHQKDHEALLRAKDCQPIPYPKPDGVITFDRLSSVYLANIAHEENQPVHLTLRQPEQALYNWEEYHSPEQYYCPANVYEILHKEGKPQLQINAGNCIHCKTCDIKDPTQNIRWIPPEGGSGPNYPQM